MPHLEVHAQEEDLAGREGSLIGALTAAVAGVYGEWVREQVEVRLNGLPRARWGIGGRVPEAPTVAIKLSVREELFARPDATQVIDALVGAVTDAVAAVLGEPARPGVRVELVATPAGRTATAGVINR
jgi:phenylpyruvate tautomerase PptA (4-oxalocrotonate tautomerase family)